METDFCHLIELNKSRRCIPQDVICVLQKLVLASNNRGARNRGETINKYTGIHILKGPQ